jgi:tetratricopeptide (TPR) repeat protein
MTLERAWGAGARALAGVLVMLGCTLADASAHAQASADSKEYRSTIDLAVREYSAGNWEEALLRFRNAHAIYPNARTLRGMGLTAYELRDYVRAIGWLQDAINSTDNALTAEQRTETEKALAAARDYAVRLTLSIEPTNAAVTIDGAPPVRDEAGLILMNPGEHELIAEAEGYEAVRRALRANAGDRPTLVLQLQVRGAEASLAAPPAALERSTDGSVLPWIVIGAGVAVTVTGAVFLGLSLSDKAEVEDAPDGTRWSAIEDAEGRVGTFSAIGFVLLGVGVAGTTAGIMWKLSEDSERPVQASVGLDHIALKGAF